MFAINKTIKSVLNSDFVRIARDIPGKVRDAFLGPKSITIAQWLQEMNKITPTTFDPKRMKSYLPKKQKTLDKITSHHYDQCRVVEFLESKEKRKEQNEHRSFERHLR